MAERDMNARGPAGDFTYTVLPEWGVSYVTRGGVAIKMRNAAQVEVFHAGTGTEIGVCKNLGAAAALALALSEMAKAEWGARARDDKALRATVRKAIPLVVAFTKRGMVEPSRRFALIGGVIPAAALKGVKR